MVLKSAFPAGLTQTVIDVSSPIFATVEGLRAESVVTVTGRVVKRTDDTINDRLPTGHVEVVIDAVEVQSTAEVLPIQVAGDAEFPEDLRLKYRFIDLRRERLHKNLVLRSNVISSIRRRMIDQGFTEFQTPILTASSPEGARDFLVPSRLHPGKFYALPQAPQQFKQLCMVAGFDRYFQIAPCFRDEDARADRSPGEFYQLDFEMSFVTQDDVFAAIEPVLAGVFQEFADGRGVTSAPFPRITFDDAMRLYGSDKPDLRNPLLISDVTEPFRGSNFGIFARNIDKGSVVRAIPAPGAAGQPRSYFDKANDWARRMRCSLSVTRKKPQRSLPVRFARRSVMIWTFGQPADLISAGSSTSRCSSVMNRPARLNSATTRSPCRRAVLRHWKR